MKLRFLLLLLAVMIPYVLLGKIQVNKGGFYEGNHRMEIVGVNIDSEFIKKDSLKHLRNMGFNALRVKVKNSDELKHILKSIRKQKMGLWVVLANDFDISTITKLKKYREILAWEVPNLEIATLLKKNISDQLVCVSCEEGKTISQSPSRERLERSNYVDCLTMQLCPVDYGWVAPTNLFLGIKNAFLQMTLYTEELYRTSNNKPLVVTSCTYPRDKMFRYEGSSTMNRDAFFAAVLSKMKGEAPQIAACFFSYWTEVATISDDTPRKRASYSIYASDESTKQIILSNTK